MIHGMSEETARRYIEIIDEITKIVDKIYAIAYMIGVLSVVEYGAIDIRPDAVGFLGKEMANEVLRIPELLDDHFIPRAEVLLELEALKDDE